MEIKRVLLLMGLTIIFPSVLWAGSPVYDTVGIHSEGALLYSADAADRVKSSKPILIAQAAVSPENPVPAGVATGTPAPAATGTPVPAATGTPAPAATGTPAPAATGTPAPAATGTPAPQGKGGAASAGEAPPMGQAAGGSGESELSGDVLERKSNIIHPFMAINGAFTDNVYNTRYNRKSDFGIALSPGIYLAVPGLRERIIPMGVVPIAPGGANMTGFRPTSPRDLQTYLYYRADIESFANESSLNSVSHLAEAALQYNFRGGLQLQLEDQFNYSHNQRGTGLSFGLDKYYANLASISARYQISEKTLVRVDYGNYFLQYVDSGNDFRDRFDNKVSAYFFYKVFPKTAFFVEYEYVNTSYKEDVVSGSMEHHGFFGVKHDITDKTRGMLKVGYGVKEFDHRGIQSTANLYAEAQLDHKFTPKSSIILTAVRRTDETDVAGAASIVETTGDATFVHKITPKLTGDISLRFSDEIYNGEVTYGSTSKRLHDQYLRAGASLLYSFRDWLSFKVGYYFTDRMSNFNDLSYTNNTAYFRISAIY